MYWRATVSVSKWSSCPGCVRHEWFVWLAGPDDSTVTSFFFSFSVSDRCQSFVWRWNSNHSNGWISSSWFVGTVVFAQGPPLDSSSLFMLLFLSIQRQDRKSESIFSLRLTCHWPVCRKTGIIFTVLQWFILFMITVKDWQSYRHIGHSRSLEKDHIYGSGITVLWSISTPLRSYLPSIACL